jgi:hypothetical protein
MNNNDKSATPGSDINDPPSQLPALDALNYHRKQAQWANVVLLAFLGVLVVFTLYRVVIELNLDAKLSSVEEYKEAMTRAETKEKELEGVARELNFIRGKDSSGELFTKKTLLSQATEERLADYRASGGGASSFERRLLLERLSHESTLQPQSEAMGFHRKYSPFFKECRFEKGAQLDVEKPTAFLASALAQLAEKFIREDAHAALQVLCTKTPMSDATRVPDADAVQILSFAKAMPTGGTLTERGQCDLLRPLAATLSGLTQASWFPGVGNDGSKYILEANDKCTLTSTFLDDAADVRKIASALEQPILERLKAGSDLIATESELKTIDNLVKLDQVMAWLGGAQSSEEKATIDRLAARANQLAGEIRDVRDLKVVPDDGKNLRAEFSLVQLLFSALFVVAALTAAVSTAYLSRSHLYEVVEVERYLRCPAYAKTPKINPFSKEPKPVIDLAALKDLVEKAKSLSDSTTK